MRQLLILSLAINFLYLLYEFRKKGGFDFIINKFKKVRELTYEEYYLSKKSIFEVAPIQEGAIVFLGDSLTDYCNWEELFQNSKISNRGINGDKINGVMQRLDSIVATKPSKIFLLIGINDLDGEKPLNEIAAAYKNLVSQIKEILPETTLYLQSLLPTNNRERLKNHKIIQFNEQIKAIAQDFGLNYIDLFTPFANKANKLNPTFTFDGLHLNGAGYLVWKREIEGFVEG
jgi:lysophospholipase L1-like esterase